jgi:hypothetical protein
MPGRICDRQKYYGLRGTRSSFLMESRLDEGRPPPLRVLLRSSLTSRSSSRIEVGACIFPVTPDSPGAWRFDYPNGANVHFTSRVERYGRVPAWARCRREAPGLSLVELIRELLDAKFVE